MERNIPGTIYVEGRKFIYIECESLAAFDDVFFNIGIFGDSPPPTGGGMINENIVITTPYGKKFCGVSYKGDLEGWERKINECIQELDIECAVIEDQYFVPRKNKKTLLSECEIEYI